jgi:tetratricopeptide (TPR) repeat protein
MALYRCNVDYSGSGVTWGCHESYQHRRSHAELAPNLIPHLVTRLVYTGAGGFDNKKKRLEFLLSPRVPHLVHEVGADTPERGIYNTRDEPLSAGGFNRLHVICGESLCSELSNYLKLGTTALVVRLVDAGVCQGSALALRDPLRAMRLLARDPSLRARVELVDGRRLTALEIQAEYLALVEAQLGADFMPPWAPELCARWRGALEQLASDPQRLATSLDWAIKHALFRDRMDRAKVRATDLPRASGLGAELCEIDTCFGELSERALFHALDEAGALAHRIPERGAVEDAIVEPPAGARAEARGHAIRELHRERSRYWCRWDGIIDRKQERILDLSDPFATSARWRESPALRPPAPQPERGSRAQRHIDRGIDAYNAQDLARAAGTLSLAVRDAAVAGDRESEAEARFWCSASHHDTGNLAEAESVLAPALALPDLSPATRIRVWTRHALIQIERPAPLAEIELALAGAREACRLAGGGMGRSRITLNEARVLGARGRNPEAILKAEQAVAESPTDPIHFSEGSHLRWLLTFLLRAGRHRRALTVLEDWHERFAHTDEVSYLGVSLAIAESALSLSLGRKSEALDRAASALVRSSGFLQHRCRLAACIAYLESAAASGKFECTGAVLEELRAWREVQIGELRFEMLRAEALVHLAWARGDGAPVGTESAEADPRQAAWRSFGEMYRAARTEAEALDRQLECGRHVLELDERIRQLG